MTNDKNEALLRDFYETKSALDILSKEVDEKKKLVLEYLKTLPDTKTSVDGVGFYVRTTPRYEFSGFVDNLIEELKTYNDGLKLAKKTEIEAGTATVVSEAFAVVVKQPKN